MKCDVCIIGAGPAGLMGAIFAAKAGANTTIVESNTVAGRKLLRTARGRCNLSHTGSIDEFIKSYGKFGRFLRHSLHEFSHEDVRKFFADLRLQTKVEKDGCVFPITNRATDVKRVLIDNARRLGVRFLYGKKVRSIKKDISSFVVEAGGDTVEAKSVVIATGGVSWPFTGSAGDGYKFAESFGHEIVEPKAALIPLVTKETWPGRMRGLGIEKVIITAKLGNKKIKAAGSMMFTDDGIGGPAVFDLSRMITDFLAESDQSIQIFIDVLCDLDRRQLDNRIIAGCGTSPKRELAGVLTGILPRSLAIEFCERLGPKRHILAGQLLKEQRAQLIKLIKSMPLTVKSTRPIAEATVTRGGIETSGIDSKTMQSKLCPGLFFAGEVINVDGPCGGYNLQIAWSTAALAGTSAAKAALKP